MAAALDLAWEAVAATPDDPRCVDVLADLLLERGDPLGTFLRNALELNRRPDDVALRLEVLRAQRAFEDRFGGHAITWSRLGLMEAVRYTRRQGGDLPAVLSEALSRALRLLRWWSFDDERQLAALDDAPPSLLELDVSLSSPRAQPFDLSPTLAGLPRLTTLHAQGHVAFGGVRHDALETLAWSAFVRPGDEVIAELCALRLPALRSLSLGIRAGTTPWPLDLLSGHHLPCLRALSLAGTLWPHQLEELAACGLLRQLEELHLGVEPLPDFERILSETADRFDHLARFTRPRAF
jgi:hypothetical protein